MEKFPPPPNMRGNFRGRPGWDHGPPRFGPPRMNFWGPRGPPRGRGPAFGMRPPRPPFSGNGDFEEPGNYKFKCCNFYDTR